MLTPLKAIRAKCLDCVLGNRAEVKKCPSRSCPLWAYRMGHRPKKDTGNINTHPEEETAQPPPIKRKVQTKGGPI